MRSQAQRRAAAALTLWLLPSAALAAESRIQDNSFLVEEAYNQEPGVIQHISTFTRSRAGSWLATFTEEWPAGDRRHQVSLTLQAHRPGSGRAGFGDLLANYRWQAIGDGDSPVAFAPRLSLLLPTGDARAGHGGGGAGLQLNLPLSAALGNAFVTHVNAGATFVPNALAASGDRGALAGFAVGQSFIWLAHPCVNVLAEGLYAESEIATTRRLERMRSFTLSPGVRAAWDVPGGLQIVGGLGFPIGIGPSRGERAVLLYLSFEHPM